jgi:hypothetical protein
MSSNAAFHSSVLTDFSDSIIDEASRQENMQIIVALDGSKVYDMTQFFAIILFQFSLFFIANPVNINRYGEKLLDGKTYNTISFASYVSLV